MNGARLRLLLLVLAVCADAALIAVGCGPMNPTAGPGGGGTPGSRHHPQGFSAPSVHAPAAKLVSEDCTTCHGANLDGQGAQIDPNSLTLAPQGCNTHHNLYKIGASADAWRTDCTFCHGDRSGTYDLAKSGAPPRDLKDVGCSISASTCTPVVPDATMVSALAFRKHREHLTATAGHMARTLYDCATCHPGKPTDAMSPGHWIVADDTPGVPDVRAILVGSAGVPAAGGSWTLASGSCQNTWCHGDGKGANGTVSQTATSGTGVAECSFCHKMVGIALGVTVGLSVPHAKHVAFGSDACHYCHPNTVTVAGTAIADRSLHINGSVDVPLTFVVDGATMNWNPATRECTGTCHNPNDVGTSRPHNGTTDQSTWN